MARARAPVSIRPLSPRMVCEPPWVPHEPRSLWLSSGATLLMLLVVIIDDILIANVGARLFRRDYRGTREYVKHFVLDLWPLLLVLLSALAAGVAVILWAAPAL